MQRLEISLEHTQARPGAEEEGSDSGRGWEVS